MAWLSAWGEAQHARLRAKTARQWRHRASRPYPASAAACAPASSKSPWKFIPTRILRMKQKRLPGGDCFSQSDAGARRRQYGINTNAPHPHAAALFVDFVLSAEGAKILAGTGRVPRRKGARSIYDELANLGRKRRTAACRHRRADRARIQADGKNHEGDAGALVLVKSYGPTQFSSAGCCKSFLNHNK